MAELADLLPRALVAERPPRDPAELIGYAGGRRELVQALAGMDHSPRRREYPDEQAWKADYTKWRTAERRVQRMDTAGKEGKQLRGQKKGVHLTSVQSRRVRQAGTTRKVNAMRKRGARSRMKATITIKSPGARGREDTRLREMPAGGPGVLIGRQGVDSVLEALREGDSSLAAERFEEEFMTAYGMDPNTTIDDVEWLRIWPDGDREPGLGTGGR